MFQLKSVNKVISVLMFFSWANTLRLLANIANNMLLVSAEELLWLSDVCRKSLLPMCALVKQCLGSMLPNNVIQC